MKVQITVDEMVWRAARVSALGSGETMGEFVSRAIINLTGPVAKPIQENDTPNQYKQVEQGTTKSGRISNVGGKS